MALWDLICDKCNNKLKDIDIPVTQDDLPKCQCGAEMRKDYSTISMVVMPDIPPHYNESLGCWVKSRQDLRAKLWENNAYTETINPAGGLTKEERAIKNGEPTPEQRKTIFERRKEPFWGMNPSSPEDGLYAD
jgi:hypothetical protein